MQGDDTVNRISLKATYRSGQPIAAYVYLPREAGGRVGTTERIDEAVTVDRIAAQCGPDRLLDLLRSLGQSGIDRDEFLPLAAA